MTSEKPELKPITPARVVQEIEKLASERKAGNLKPDLFDQRFARMIGELRDRKIDGTRADIIAAIAPLKQSGAITEAELHLLLKKLGLE